MSRNFAKANPLSFIFYVRSHYAVTAHFIINFVVVVVVLVLLAEAATAVTPAHHHPSHQSDHDDVCDWSW